MKNNILYDVLGNYIEGEIILFYKSFNNFDYVFYTDNLKDSDGDYNIYVSHIIEIKDKMVFIEDISCEEEYEMLKKVLDEVKEGIKNGK